ncbi:MAG: hypothetical protein WAL71_09900 [Terriglobales bacterium]|jgi:hypothetical protein
MKSATARDRGISTTIIAAAFVLAALCFSTPSAAQTLAHRLILKDGSYQSITKYEVGGERVRYFSAERGEWEEVPKALVDWDATKKYEDGLLTGAPAPEAAELDRELETERKAAEARSPQVAPGLHLPDDTGVFLLDTYQNQPELAEIEQSGSDLNRNTGSNILRSAINPLAGSKQTIEIPEAHAKVQAHTAVPSLYANLDVGQGATASAQAPGEPPPLSQSDRFKIIRLDVKGGKRVAGSVKTAVTGKTKTDERFIPATVTPMTGGWVKITPVDPLPNGEYAVAEMLGKDGMNLYVWDFGVNPAAPANLLALKPEPTLPPKNDASPDLQKREKQ